MVVSSTSMKVGSDMIVTISHGLYRPAAERVGVQPSVLAALAMDYRTLTVGMADMPGPMGYLRGSGPFFTSNVMRTGTRCTTFT